MKNCLFEKYKSPNDQIRYILGTNGVNPLIVLGLNPSTADDCKPDMTVSKIKGFIKNLHYDSFIIINLYPLRTSNPKKLGLSRNDEIHNENLRSIKEEFSKLKNIHILAAWGEPILTKPYLLECLSEIIKLTEEFNANWLQIGEPTKSGHPRHPSRAPYKYGFQKFDVLKYIHSIHH